MKTELISNSLETLAIKSKNVISTATVAREYRRIFEDVSTKLLVRCLKFLLKKMREVVITKQEKEVWTRFWALVNSTPALKESLAETPVVKLTFWQDNIKTILDRELAIYPLCNCLLLHFSTNIVALVWLTGACGYIVVFFCLLQNCKPVEITSIRFSFSKYHF